MTKSTKNPFVEIFKDFWTDFKEKYPSYQPEYYDTVVGKMLGCGDPAFGYIEYGCMHCGQHKHLVAFTCKSNLCLRCGRVKSENFVYEVMNKLHPGVIYRHLTLTIPDQLIQFFYKRRHEKELYNAFYRIGWEYIQDVFSHVTKKKLRCGAIVVLHTTGRKGNFRPHLHIIVMNGGVDTITGDWVNIGYFPYEEILPRKWQWHLLNLIKDFDSSAETKKLVSELWDKYPNGFYNNFQKGNVPSKSQEVVKYLSKYLFRPQISVKRIPKYDKKKKEIVYEYADHKTGKSEVETVSALVFIGRMVQQILPKGFHRVKYYGLHHPKTFEKSKKLVLAGVQKIYENVIQFDRTMFRVAADSYQERMKLWTGRDPLKCPGCNSQMEIIKVWTKSKGVVFDLLDEYKKRGRPPDELISLSKVKPTEPVDIMTDFFEQLDLAI